MGRYAKLAEFQISRVSVFSGTHGRRCCARTMKFDLLFSQHAISAVAAGKLKRKIGHSRRDEFSRPAHGLHGNLAGLHRAAARSSGRSCATKFPCPCATGVDGVLAHFRHVCRIILPGAVFRAKKSARFITATTRKIFRFAQACCQKTSRRSSSCTARSTRIISARLRLTRCNSSTRKRPETIFRFVGQRTGALEKFLQRAQREIAGFKFEATGFVPYAEVAKHLADASVGIVPYEESAGTHCAFVAKIVEYVASGLPRSARR